MRKSAWAGLGFLLAGGTVWPQIAPMIRGARFLAAHNAPFDLPFLIELFREAGVPGLLNPVVDTLGLARGLSGAGSNRLEDVARREGVPVPGAHRAHRAGYRGAPANR